FEETEGLEKIFYVLTVKEIENLYPQKFIAYIMISKFKKSDDVKLHERVSEQLSKADFKSLDEGIGGIIDTIIESESLGEYRFTSTKSSKKTIKVKARIAREFKNKYDLIDSDIETFQPLKELVEKVQDFLGI